MTRCQYHSRAIACSFIHNSKQNCIILTVTIGNTPLINGSSHLVSVLGKLSETELVYIRAISDLITGKGKYFLCPLVKVGVISGKFLASLPGRLCR